MSPPPLVRHHRCNSRQVVIMIKRSPSLRVYHAALLDYILGSGESGLAHAYDLGRGGFDEGCSPLQILDMHGQALTTILESTPEAAEVRRRSNASAEFLAEALSPFDMASRGYRALLKNDR
jgi:phosphoserine phosphatase RsbU-like protein